VDSILSPVTTCQPVSPSFSRRNAVIECPAEQAQNITSPTEGMSQRANFPPAMICPPVLILRGRFGVLYDPGETCVVLPEYLLWEQHSHRRHKACPADLTGPIVLVALLFGSYPYMLTLNTTPSLFPVPPLPSGPDGIDTRHVPGNRRRPQPSSTIIAWRGAVVLSGLPFTESG